MQVLRLLAARRAVSTITAAAPPPFSEVPDSEAEDEGPFFDLDFSSVRASFSSASASGSESDDACTVLAFVISLQRSRSASPSYESIFFGGPAPPQLKFCASKPKASLLLQYGCKRGSNLRTLSFGAKKAAFYGGRPNFARSSSSARSLRLFMESPADEEEVTKPRRAPSGDVIRRCLTKISRQFRSVRPRAAGEARGLCLLRKSRSAPAAVTVAASGPLPPSRRDDSLIEKQDGIASAIEHCKESLHRASMSECDSSLLRSWSDPGKCEAA